MDSICETKLHVYYVHIMSFLISVQSFTLLSFDRHYFSLDLPPTVISINPAKERFYIKIKIQAQIQTLKASCLDKMNKTFNQETSIVKRNK